jgi:hypothetical protein
MTRRRIRAGGEGGGTVILEYEMSKRRKGKEQSNAQGSLFFLCALD